jgi:hypothetical protein
MSWKEFSDKIKMSIGDMLALKFRYKDFEWGCTSVEMVYGTTLCMPESVTL